MRASRPVSLERSTYDTSDPAPVPWANEMEVLPAVRVLLRLRIALFSVGVVTLAGCGSSSGPAVPDRTVQVWMTDQLRFEPGTLSVKAGETVSFQVQNTGALEHEFVLGDQRMQDQHEHEMQGMNGGMSGTHSAGNNAIDVPPGQTKTLTFTFPSAPGTYVYGCHVNGHYASGMRGTVTIT